MYKSSFGAKTSGPLADQKAFAPETTTGMSLKPCETRREREFLLAMRKLHSSAAARWTYTHPLTTTGMSVKPCEARREREFLLAMRKLRSSAVDLYTPLTTTGMSVKPCETRREREFLLAMRKLRSSAAARWTYTHPLTTKGKSGSALSFSNDLNTSILETVRIIYQRYSCGLILLQLGIQTVRIGFFQKLLCGVCRHGKLNLISCLRFFLL